LKVDYLIVGQGLAGSLLAWHLLGRGQRVLVVDPEEEVTSSKVAAGLVTPLAGNRFNIPDGLGERLDYARSFYWSAEEATKRHFFHHKRIARLFRSEDERETWKSRIAEDPEAYEKFSGPLTLDDDKIAVPYGGFEMKGGGWMDLPEFLSATRYHLLERLGYAIGRIDPDEVAIEENFVKWKNIEADGIIFAQGWQGNQNRFFDWIPIKPTVGDILDLAIPEISDVSHILNSGGWLIPKGSGTFSAGSTYRHDLDDPYGYDGGRAEVIKKVTQLTRAPFEVSSQRTGIRPVIRRSQVFMGRHPSQSRVFFFNGLGSKGVLNGPWHASRLVDHILGGVSLPDCSDIRSNFL
tara:strand:- start:6132 stop:7181 length:1050 start_codon:yes stop_codon:yes gene_type:complete